MSLLSLQLVVPGLIVWLPSKWISFFIMVLSGPAQASELGSSHNKVNLLDQGTIAAGKGGTVQLTS